MALFWMNMLLFGCIQLSSETVPTVSEGTLKTWVTDILDQVSYLAESDKRTPRLYAFGNKSFPILTGESEMDAVIVAAELGEGRIIAVGEGEFLNPAVNPEYGCLEDGDELGVKYTGKLSHTKSNIPCQDWREMTPHKHPTFSISDFPDDTMDEVANNCRNPTGHNRGLWCYTMDPLLKLEKCEVPSCSDTDTQQVMQFQKNARKWLSRDTAGGGESVCYINDVANLACLDNKNMKVTITYAQEVLATAEADTKMSSWIQQGGGLLYGLELRSYTVYPWTFALFYDVLTKAGIGYQDKKASGVEPTQDVYPLDTADSVPNEIYVPDATDSAISLLHSLSMPHAISHITEMAHINPPTAFVANMTLMTCEFKHGPPTLLARREIMRPFTSFVHSKESEMTWPPCDSETQVYEDASEGVKYMFRLLPCMGFLGLWRTRVAPNVDKCPGILRDVNAERLDPIVTVDIATNELLPTVYYLAPGNTLDLTVLSTDDPSWTKCILYVGIHNDDVVEAPPYKRPPIMARRFMLTETTMTISSPWGGIISFLSAKDQPTYMKVQLHGVVRAPHYKLGEDSASSWQIKRLYPAPWGLLEGHHMSFILLSEHLRLVDDPAPILKAWDAVVISSYELAGVPRSQWHRESFTTDIELFRGKAHAGYPIKALMAHYGDPDYDRWPLNLDNMPNTWGLYHEIGHNLQENVWTFQGFDETTNNVFTLFNMEEAGQTDPLLANDEWYADVLKEGIFSNIINSKDFSLIVSGANNREMLLLYTQLYRQFGWGCYREIFKSYEDDLELEKDLPKEQQDRYDSWVSRWSHLTGYNLCPLFEFWTYPITICAELSDLPAFLPSDDITQNDVVKTRVAELSAKYPSLLRELPKKPACYVPTFKHKQQMINQLKNSVLLGYSCEDLHAKYNPPPHKWYNINKVIFRS